MTIQIPQAQLIPINELKVDGENPNRMTDSQLERLKTSIEKYGFIVPIITNKDLLVADGEQRLTIAQELHLQKVPVIRLAVEDVDRRLLRQVLNKLRGEHNLIGDALEFERIIEAGHEDELKHLLDLSDSQLERYLVEIREPKDETYEIPEIDKIKTTIKRGDIYKLDSHSLMCGDATSKQDVEALMNGEKADMVFTDPPFAIYGSSTGVKTEIADNNLIKPFFRDVGSILQSTLSPRGHAYIYCDWRTYPTVKQEIEKYLQLKNNIVVAKKKRYYTGSFYANSYENLAFFINEPRTSSTFSAVKNPNTPKHRLIYQSNVWNGDIVPLNEREHFAQKPLDPARHAIKNSSSQHNIVLDLFGGSGSTLIACQQTGRTCYMMEIDPRYCQVIIDRWEAYTGGKAEKLN